MQRLLSGNGFFKANGVGSLGIAAAMPWVGDEFNGASLDPRWAVIGHQTGLTIAASGGQLDFRHNSANNSLLATPIAWVDGSSVSARVIIPSNIGFPGLCVYNTANGRSIAFGHSGYAGSTYIWRRNAFPTMTEADRTTYTKIASGTNTLHQRIRQVGTDLLFESSSTGDTWFLHRTEPIADWMVAIDRIGFLLEDNSSNTRINVDWIRNDNL